MPRKPWAHGRKPQKQERHEVTCDDCGERTTVPFKPRSGKPVYCRDCLSFHE